jgi:hypothetical protein
MIYNSDKWKDILTAIHSSYQQKRGLNHKVMFC